MLVIHPIDRTTSMLSALYNGIAGTRLLDCTLSSKAIERELRHTSRTERIMLLGHGCDKGLYWRRDDSQPDFDRIVVGHPHAYSLRKHGSNIVAVFCNADLFARAEGLHGLFTGMIISEMSEAEEYGVRTSQEDLDVETLKFCRRLRALLDEECPLSEIPEKMLQLDDVHSQLTDFNYHNIFYL